MGLSFAGKRRPNSQALTEESDDETRRTSDAVSVMKTWRKVFVALLQVQRQEELMSQSWTEVVLEACGGPTP